MKDRSLRLDLRGRMGRIVVAALAAACLGVIFTTSFALTASTSRNVLICIGKPGTIDAKELYVRRYSCGANVQHFLWPRPDGHGIRRLCKGDPNDGSIFKTELYIRDRNHRCYGSDPIIKLALEGPKGRSHLCV